MWLELTSYIISIILSQGTVAAGSSDDALRSSTQTLVTAVADYKQAAKSAKGLAKKPAKAAAGTTESSAWAQFYGNHFGFGQGW